MFDEVISRIGSISLPKLCFFDYKIYVEAMACGLPLVASDIRGHRDVIAGFEGGILCDLSAPRSFADAVLLLEKNAALRAEISVRNVERARRFSDLSAVRYVSEIYEGLMANCAANP